MAPPPSEVVHKMKRTRPAYMGGFARESTSALPAQSQTPQKTDDKGKPLRIVSDILPPGSAPAKASSTLELQPPKNGVKLASHAMIGKLQKQWEQGREQTNDPGSVMQAERELLGDEDEDGSASMISGDSSDSSSDEDEILHAVKPRRVGALSNSPELSERDAFSKLGSQSPVEPPLHSPPAAAFTTTAGEKLAPTSRKSSRHNSAEAAKQISRPEANVPQLQVHRAKARQITETAVQAQMERINNIQVKAAIKAAHQTYVAAPKPATPQALTASKLMANVSEYSETIAKSLKGAGIPPHISVTPSGHNYHIYIGPDGIPQSNRGALIPPNAKFSDDPNYPFVCCVRGCTITKNYATLTSYGGHFSVLHTGDKFNDNGDGTLSKVGEYKAKNGPSPAIVVSIGPCPSVPFQPVGKPPQQRKKRSLDASKHVDDMRPIKKPKITLVPLPINVQQTDVVEYLHSFLSPKQHVPKRRDIAAMSRLPRRRLLPQSWIKYHGGKLLEKLHYSCALAYLTGDEVEDSLACKRHSRGKGAKLSDVCVAMSSSLSEHIKTAFSRIPCCVACRYYIVKYRQGNDCLWSSQTWDSDLTGAAARGEMATKSIQEVIEIDDDEDDEEEEEEEDDAGSGSEQGSITSEPDEIPESESMAETDVSPGTDSSPAASADHTALSDLEPAKPLIDTRLRQGSQQSKGGLGRLPTAAPSMFPNVHQLSEVELEVEDWEFAPGRIVDEATNENIIYSTGYLSTTQPVMISQDVGVNVIFIQPGTNHHWAADEDKIRSCSVTGKVIVKIGDKAHKVGTNGVFIIRPGRSCTVENRLYVGAVIHCTTIQEPSL